MRNEWDMIAVVQELMVMASEKGGGDGDGERAGQSNLEHCTSAVDLVMVMVSSRTRSALSSSVRFP